MDDVNSATEVSLASLRSMSDVNIDPATSSIRLTYTSKEEYKKMARQLGLMEDFRVNVIYYLTNILRDKCPIFLLIFSEWSRKDSIFRCSELFL